jgi:hypothetical protein
MPPSPGRASSDSEADRFTSGRGVLASARGIGAGNGIPRPCATPFARSAETFRSIDTTRSRTAGTVHLLSSKRKAATMCACSTALWLSKNSVAWL